MQTVFWIGLFPAYVVVSLTLLWIIERSELPRVWQSARQRKRILRRFEVGSQLVDEIFASASWQMYVMAGEPSRDWFMSLWRQSESSDRSR